MFLVSLTYESFQSQILSNPNEFLIEEKEMAYSYQKQTHPPLKRKRTQKCEGREMGKVGSERGYIMGKYLYQV